MSWKTDWRKLTVIIAVFLGCFYLPVGIARWARKLTQPAGDSRYRGERFDAETLRSLFERFDCKRSFAIPGGRERVGVFEGRA